jgi:hypothetical protein
MASAAASAGARRGTRAGTRTEARPARTLEAAELAWVAAVPCALLTLALVLLIGGPLGRALLTPRASEAFWPAIARDPQPAEHGRFLVGLIGPPLLAAVVLATLHRRVRLRLRLPASAIRPLVLASQLVGLAFVALCFAAQNNVIFSADFYFWPHRMYFKWPTLLVAAALPLAAWALLRGSDAGARFAAAVRETPTRRLACIAAAALYTAIWMLTAIELDSSIGTTIEAVSGHLLWTMAEPFAVLNGRTPLVDFHAQYGQVWAYLAAAPMALFGATIFTYTTAMAMSSTLVMLAVYAIFRRLTRSSLVALSLYLPFLATAFFMVVGPPSDRYGPENTFILWPIRYAGPFVLAWLLSRHLDGGAPRRPWPLFAVAGLVVVNNPDFGMGSALATLVGLACATPPRSWRAAGRLVGVAAAGMLGGIAAFALFTLLRSGSLPHFGLLFEFSRLYGIGGWEQLPMPELGLHLAVFLTFAAALVLAAVRVARAEPDRLLTALLAWIGTFGLAASLYFAGRAHPMALFDFFAPWAFAIVLLLLVVVRALAARAWRRPTVPDLAVLFGFGLVICSLPQTPTPWSQVDRISERTPVPVFKQPEAERLVAQTTHPGEKVTILATLGHRIAYDVGVVNVSPYASSESIATAQQLRTTIGTARREGARKLYLALGFTRREQLAALAAAGFAPVRYDRAHAYVELLDRGAR